MTTNDELVAFPSLELGLFNCMHCDGAGLDFSVAVQFASFTYYPFEGQTVHTYDSIINNTD